MSERERGDAEEPLAILDRRLAAGEIDRRQYEELRSAITSNLSGSRVMRRRTPSTSWLAIVIVIGVVLASAITAMALAYGPSRSSQGGMWPWGGWGGHGGMGGMGHMDDGMGGGSGDYSPGDISIVNFAYSPQEIRISPGTTVTWVNLDSVMHTVSFGEHGDEHGSGAGIDSGPMNYMDAWSYTFEEPGVYEYHCDPHPYMTGKVIVEG